MYPPPTSQNLYKGSAFSHHLLVTKTVNQKPYNVSFSLTLSACSIRSSYATWWHQWDVLFLFGFMSQTINLKPPWHTKKGDPGPLCLQTHAKTSRANVSEGWEKREREEKLRSLAGAKLEGNFSYFNFRIEHQDGLQRDGWCMQTTTRGKPTCWQPLNPSSQKPSYVPPPPTLGPVAASGEPERDRGHRWSEQPQSTTMLTHGEMHALYHGHETSRENGYLATNTGGRQHWLYSKSSAEGQLPLPPAWEVCQSPTNGMARPPAGEGRGRRDVACDSCYNSLSKTIQTCMKRKERQKEGLISLHL